VVVCACACVCVCVCVYVCTKHLLHILLRRQKSSFGLGTHIHTRTHAHAHTTTIYKPTSNLFKVLLCLIPEKTLFAPFHGCSLQSYATRGIHEDNSQHLSYKAVGQTGAAVQRKQLGCIKNTAKAKQPGSTGEVCGCTREVGGCTGESS